MPRQALYPLVGAELDLSSLSPDFLTFGPFPMGAIVNRLVVLASANISSTVRDNVGVMCAVTHGSSPTQALLDSGRRLWLARSGSDVMFMGSFGVAAGNANLVVDIPMYHKFVDDRYLIFKALSDLEEECSVGFWLGVDLSQVESL